MDAALILEKLSKFSDVMRFVSLLEIQSSLDEKLSSRLKIAKKLLDKSLTSLVFDIQNNLETSKTHQPLRILISSDIEEACDQLDFFDKKMLSLTLRDLVSFSKDYESISNPISPSKDPKDLQNLRSKILLITAERFC